LTFLAAAGATQTLTPGVASATTQLSKPATANSYLMKVSNTDATVTAFIKFGTSAGMAAATIADFPVPPLYTFGLDVPLGTTHMAIIGFVNSVATAATNASYFTPCYGASYL
jgi:hypothetical protein